MNTDVCIVGGGLMGCFAALFLRQRNLSVVLLEKGAAGAAASGVNFGNLRLQGRNPVEFPLSLRAREIWEGAEALLGETCGVVSCGHAYLGLAAADQPKLDEYARQAQDAGLEVEILDGSEARTRWPFLSPAVTGVSWSKRDGVADPNLAAPAVCRAARRARARILEHTAAERIEALQTGFRVTMNSGAVIEAASVVNAAGAWAGMIAAAFGEPVPMFAAGPPLFSIAPKYPFLGPSLHAVDGTLLLRPAERGTAVVGSFPRVPADTVSGTAPVPPDRVERGLRRLSEVVPALASAAVTRVWSGVEGYLPDMLPIIGWSTTTPGFFHAFGFSGHGFQLAPGVGAVIADIIAEGRTATPLDAFAVSRFASGVQPDERLWSEFDPSLTAAFKRDQPGGTHA